MDVLDGFVAETTATQTDEVDAAIAGWLLAGNDVRRNILRETATALDHHVACDVAELMNENVGADDGVVIYNHLAGKLGRVTDNQAAAQLAVVSHVNSLHQEVVAAYHGLALRGSTTRDSNILTDAVVIAHLEMVERNARTYQVLKSLLKKDPDLSFDKSKFTVVSPDEGAMNRNMYFSSVLGCNLGMFYKRRDYTRVVNGRNPIVAHEYLGESVEGKTVFIADDIIASGESMLEVASNLKERGAANIIANATFPLFTSGLEKFDKAVAEGKLTYVVGTNLTYRMPELLTRDWYVDVDVSKYAAYFVVALNHDMSVSSIIDPLKKIENLLASRK